MENLKVACIQADLYWENTTANLANFEEKIAKLESNLDLIILPEMFNTGFTMEAQKVSEPMNLTTFKWMKQIAESTKAVICGSFIVRENGKNYNRFLWMQPDGQFDFYDKRHLFRMGGEHEVFTAGNKRVIKELKGWKICLMVCYDLRFPVWSRNIKNEYDVLIYTANWPAVRNHVWSNLLISRALENQSYVIGVNRTGVDGKGNEHTGESAIINYKGQILATESKIETTLIQVLKKDELIDFRDKFPAYLDADEFEIKL